MTEKDPRSRPENPNADKSPAEQKDEAHGGAIKRPQQTDATMADKDLPRGSEPETRGTSGRR